MSTKLDSRPLIHSVARFAVPHSIPHFPPIQDHESEYEFYERILLNMKGGDIAPQAGVTIATEHLSRRARDYTASPTRQQARLLRIGMRAIAQFRNTPFYSKGSSGERTMQQSLDSASRMIIDCLVRDGRHPEAELYVKFGFLKEAYEAFRKNPRTLSESVTPSLLQPIVTVASERHDLETLLALAERGACLKNLSREELQQLAEKAIAGFNDKALARLVTDGCPLHDGHGQAKLLLDAVSSNLIEGVRAMLERHVNVHSTDEGGNGALHRAFFLGNIEMVRLLQRHVDPRLKNKQGHTPLQALLAAKEHNAEILQIGEADYTPFLQNVLERPSDAFQGVFFASEALNGHLKRLGGSFLTPPPGDIVEIAFLINDKPLITALFTEIPRDQFHESCQQLLARYPLEAVQQFALSHWQLDERHFATGCRHFEPPAEDPPTNPPLSDLLSLFDRINFTRPGQRAHTSPIDYLKSARETDPGVTTAAEAAALLRKDLETFIGRLTDEKHFFGTPVEGKPGFIEFFAQLKRMVKHIMAALVQKNDPEETQRVLHEFISASPLCGGRYQETILREYLKVCFGRKDERPEDAIFKSLAEFRFDLFEAIVAAIPGNDAHDFLDAKHNLGARFGIPGFQQVAAFNDPYSRIHRHDKRIEEEFRERYTPHAIVSSLVQSIGQSSELRDHYLNLQRIHGAAQWKQQHYGPLLEAVPRIQATADPEEREALTMSVYEYLGLRKMPGKSLREAILEDQKNDYLLEGVYNDEGRLRPQAVEFLLNRLGVFHSAFPPQA